MEDLNNNGSMEMNQTVANCDDRQNRITSKECPKNHLALAIVTTAIFFAPFGIPAIIHASRVNELWKNGDYSGAEEASYDAQKWCKRGIILGSIIIALSIIYCIIVVVAAVSEINNSYIYDYYY